MKKVMFTITTAAVSSLLAVSTASADFTGIQYETVENGIAGYTTHRIYAGVSGEVDAVFGDSETTLSVSSDAGFWNGPGTGASAMDNPQAFWSLFPSMEFDSQVTLGMASNASAGTMYNIGIAFAAFNTGGDFSTDNGSWYSTPDQPNVHAVGGRVLIMQLTVADDDHAFGVVSLQGKEEGAGDNWTARGVGFDTLPAPGAIALLGLAGIAARRRRK